MGLRYCQFATANCVFDPLMIKPGIAEQDSRHYPQPPVI
jgi:hypothetical protein